MNTLEQDLAQSVYEKVSAYGKAHPEDTSERKQYGSMAHRLPVLVHNAGLVHALAFVEDRDKDAQKILMEHLAAVLGFDERKNLLDESRTAPFQDYRYLTHRAVIALTWFKRFAQSVLKIEPGSEKD